MAINSRPADFRLEVGVEVGTSFQHMKEDITAIVRTLNKQPPKIKLSVDMASLSKDFNKLKTDINELRKEAGEIKFSNQISTSLTNIQSSLSTLTNSVAGVAGLKNELLALSEAMRSFQGTHINLGLSDKNPIQRMSECGQSARQTITELKTQAAEMEKIFAQTFEYTNSYREAVLAAANGTGIWEKRGTNPIKLLNSLDGSKSLSSEMAAWQSYISLMKDLANIKGVDVSSVKTNAAELVQSTKEIMTGSQEASQGIEKLKGIFGSGINSEQLIGKLDEIRLAIDRIVESLANLSAKEVKIKFDDASLEDLRAQISQILTEMSAITPKAKKGSGGGGGGSDGSAAKESKLTYGDATRAIKDYYRALNDLRTIKGSQDITLEADGWHTENAELQGLVATLNRTKTAYDLVMAAMKDMPAGQQAKLMQLLTSESTKYTIAVEKQAAAERAAAEASAKKKSDANAAKESKKSYEEATRAIEAYYSLVGKVNGTNGDVTRTSSGWVSKSGENVQLASSLNNAEKAYVGCTNAAAANARTREQNIQLERLEIAETDKLARSLEEQANKARPVAETEAAHRALMQSTLGTTNRAADILRNYQHVMKGHNETSRQAYENLKNQKVVLDDVRKKYDSGAASAEDLRKAQDNVKTATKDATETFKANGEHVSSLGTRIKGLATKFMSWLGVSQVIMYAIRSIKQMISAAVEIDSALTQLKIVTNATDAEMRQFSNTAITLAKNLGKSVTELTKSIETFSRLGYSLKDASELAKYATIMSNVAGVENDEATTGITSIVKGFNLNVSDAEHVADILVDVGQKYAVSAGELMEAYEKSGAALSATNTTLEKSAGLIAAANASVQDSSVVGTALKTVSARVRGSKTDLEELGESTDDLAEGFSKYAKEIQALTGFNIMIDDTHFKDLYDIMEGIASVWDKLSDTQQARVAEILGGTRQLQVISSIIGNWSDAAGAYETAMNSAGASARANSVYMDSVNAHLDQLKATFEELATTILNSDFSKFVIDTGKTILEILNKITSLTGSLGAILIGGGIYKGIKSIA